MSYILEALKKAQAERQLGSAPTIHAPPVTAPAAASAARMPVLAGVAAVVVLAATGLFMWQRQGAPAAPAVAGAGAATAMASAAPKTNAATAGPARVVNAAEGTAAPAAAAPAPQVALIGRPDAPAAPAPRAAVAAQVRSVAPAPVRTAPAPAAVAGASPVAAQAAVQPAPVAPANADAALGGVNSLPAAVRASVPNVAFGGYMYSPNPADRLVLVDNVLRREGEEVAPGLVLEKLLPKGAVLNYRGYRYRVAF